MSEVGKGSFATVYQGMFKEKECAIKVFNIRAAQNLLNSDWKSQLSSFVQHHPNVVLVYELLYSGNQLPDDQPAIVMELCHTNLRMYLQGKIERGDDESFETLSKLELLRDITAGMIYLHSEQIVHGNLSANNVLLNLSKSKVVAKVADFGQSRLSNPLIVNPNLATHGRRDIMPPEVKDPQSPVELTTTVDVFSFGCLIPHVASCAYPDLSSDPLG